MTTATAALQAVVSEGDLLAEESSAFVCPYPDCGAFARHRWGMLKLIQVRVGDPSFSSTYPQRTLRTHDGQIHAAYCEACEREVLFLDGVLIKPAASEAPAPTEDMPSQIASEYAEAAAILRGSPRGSAALLRLAVQKLLPLIGATKRNIDDQIGELVGNGIISARVQASLDTLRVIGNEAVHPGQIDLNDDPATALGLFRLLNFIVEKAISEPKHADEMFALLPAGKRQAIDQRNVKARAKHGAGHQNGNADQS